MTPWQRRLRTAIAVVAIAVTGAVFVTTRRRQPPPPPPSISRMDPNAAVESSGARVTDMKGEKEQFRVEAEHELTYPGGRSKLVGVTITVMRNGKTYVMKGAEAEAGENRSSITMTGKVHLEGSDGLKLDSASASYTDSEGIVRAPGMVTFSRGGMSGEGMDFTYDSKRDQIGLSDRTTITVKPDKKDPSGATIKAGAALLMRKEGFMNFERDVHITRGAQVISAERAVADLTEDEKYITKLDLNGGAAIEKTDAAPGGLRSMAAENITLQYAERSENVQHALLAGASSIKIAGERKNIPDKSLAASEAIDVALAPDGSTVTSIVAHAKVALDVPAPRGQASKSIRSNSLTASGDESGLKAAVFGDGVEYREFGGTPPVQRVARSRTLDTVLKGGFGDIVSAKFGGGAQFTDGGMQASAMTLSYILADGAVSLNGHVGNALPRVLNDQIIVDGEQIDMKLDGPKVVATGAPVRTLLRPAKAGAKGEQSRMPGLMQQDKPVNGSSDKLDYDGTNGSKATFTGNARLFQDDTTIQGTTISVDGHTGNLTAAGAVRSTLLINDTDPETKKPVATRATASGAEMTYDDAARTFTFNTAAHLVGPQGDVTAAHIGVQLAPESQDVREMRASDTVTLKENDRKTTGDKLTYSAAGDVYTMSGKVVTMVEADCRQTIGTTLTFYKSTDKLTVAGGDESRTQSAKMAAGCIPAPEKPKEKPKE